MKENQFSININSLLCGEIGAVEKKKINFLDISTDNNIASRIDGYVNLMKINDSDISAEFFLTGKSQMVCDRCLKEFDNKLELEFSQIYSLKPDTDEEDYPIINRQIDMGPIIGEELIASCPVKKLCQANCTGIKGIRIKQI